MFQLGCVDNIFLDGWKKNRSKKKKNFFGWVAGWMFLLTLSI